ncbi:alkaline phosphatase family protein [Kitasatospora sp. GAS1066B]|uniref:alkaline phosphatase family protein n=1 Tax=Kitasatospora sp. GAS1066B TaxID=3156271 RepID=UPI003515ECE7
MRLPRLAAGLTAALSLLCGLTASVTTAAQPALAAASVPRPDHVVVVLFENTSQSSIVGNSSAPYFNQLANTGANFTNSFAISHPSQPNYLDLFSGSDQGVSDDSCPHTFSSDNEGAQLIAKGLTFTGYSEGLPSVGSTACTSGEYARKHVPWTNFSNVPATDSQPFSAFPTDYTKLPTVSWVIPNLCDDIHDCSISTGDTWLKNNLDSYVQWAKTHNSLLITTFDEDDSSSSLNQIATFFNGQQVKPGTYNEQINHFSVLRTIEDMYGLPYAGAAAQATPITDAWAGSGSTGSVTVTAPGDQNGTVGTAANLQLSATDTATGTLNWTATGLPAGLSVNAASGLISGTPTTAGTSSVTVTATDSTGPSGSATFNWTVAPAAGNTVTLNNPGTQNGTVGTAADLQLTGTDSATGQTLTYTATGLPAGLTINSSGLVSGTPTTAGTSSVTATATDTTGATGSATFSWTVSPSSSGCTPAQLLGNADFETGSAAPWTATSGVINSDTVSEPAHSGNYDAWLDGYGSSHTDTLAQTVTIPTGCSANFSFWLHIDTNKTGTTAADKLTVTANGTTLATYSNLNANNGYTQINLNLSSYAGKSVALKFTGVENSSSAQTSFVIDDTALNVS